MTTKTITYVDDTTGEVRDLTLEDAAEIAADLADMQKRAAEAARRYRAELDAITAQLEAACGHDTPISCGDGRTIVLVAKPGRRMVSQQGCAFHRAALMKLGIVTEKTETVTTWSQPKVSDLDTPEVRAQLAVEDVPFEALIPTPPISTVLQVVGEAA